MKSHLDIIVGILNRSSKTVDDTTSTTNDFPTILAKSFLA
jgi:hypothetical protein